MVNFHYIKLRVKIIAKALGDLILRHHTLISCQSLDVHVPVAWPRDYEFSCSSTPAARSRPLGRSKRHNHDHNHDHDHDYMCIRQVNVVPDNPPKLKNRIDGPHDDDYDVGTCVDKAAEEFIARFYNELKLQN